MNLLKTILPNQLCPAIPTASDVNVTPDGNGGYTVNGTVATRWFQLSSNKCTIGHKYYLYLNDTTVENFRLVYDGAGLDTSSKGILTATASAYPYFFFTSQSYSYSITVRPQIVDLTLLYGAGNEPSTVAQFRADYPLDYYPYSLTNTTGLLTCANGAVTADISSMLPSGIGVVDLGSLSWYRYASGNVNVFFETQEIAQAGVVGSPSEILSENFVSTVLTTWGQTTFPVDNSVVISTSGTIQLRCDTYADVPSFKQAMQGVLLFYRKSTS